MTTASQTLAGFAARLKYEEIPAAVLDRAKDCLIDTFAACTFGSRFPWSRFVAEYAVRYGSGGPCSILGGDTTVHAPYAALANGVFAHAFEQDAVTEPGMGMHAGATLMPAILAMAQETGADGRTVLKAFVAGCEVMSRIALASRHSPEKVGFHAPGLTGCYGAAVASGVILGLDEHKMSHALGVAGSFSSGLLAFSKSQQGAMVKRLHLGRASESGVLAARLATGGYEGPETILEGKFGFLDAYCGDHHVDPTSLTAGLGSEWHTLRISMKRYAAHVNAHTSVQTMRELVTEHKFSAGDVEQIRIEGHERLASHHNITEPGDMMQGQYSVPFCVALAVHRDPEDPRSFNEEALNDPAIRATCRNVKITTSDKPDLSVRAVSLSVKLKDGREVSRAADTYKGMPRSPLTRADLRHKYMLLTKDIGEERAAAVFDRLANLESQQRFSLS